MNHISFVLLGVFRRPFLSCGRKRRKVRKGLLQYCSSPKIPDHQWSLLDPMIKLWAMAFALSELYVSSLVHMLYGFYIFSSAVASDILQSLNESFRPRTQVLVKEKECKNMKVDDLPPIVLVHGIFGFGKGVCIYHIIDMLHYMYIHVCSFDS